MATPASRVLKYRAFLRDVAKRRETQDVDGHATTYQCTGCTGGANYCFPDHGQTICHQCAVTPVHVCRQCYLGHHPHLVSICYACKREPKKKRVRKPPPVVFPDVPTTPPAVAPPAAKKAAIASASKTTGGQSSLASWCTARRLPDASKRSDAVSLPNNP